MIDYLVSQNFAWDFMHTDIYMVIKSNQFVTLNIFILIV